MATDEKDKERKLSLLDMPDEILVKIIKFHGCGPDVTPDFVKAVDFARGVGGLNEDQLPILHSPLECLAEAKPIAMTCQRLRGLFTSEFNFGHHARIYVVFPAEVKMPWPAQVVSRISHITIAPFLKLEIDPDQVGFRTVPRDRSSYEHFNDAELYWEAACDLIYGSPFVPMTLHFHHIWENHDRLFAITANRRPLFLPPSGWEMPMCSQKPMKRTVESIVTGPPVEAYLGR